MIPGLTPVMMAGGAEVGVPTLAAAGNVSDFNNDNLPASAEIQLTLGGHIINKTNKHGSSTVGAWIEPKNGMDQFSARWTNTSGAISIGTAGVWQALTATRAFGITAGAGTSETVTGTLEIARTDDTGTVLATKAGIVIQAISTDEG